MKLKRIGNNTSLLRLNLQIGEAALENLSFPCYTITRYKTRKIRSYKGSADSRRKVIYLPYMPSAAFVARHPEEAAGGRFCRLPSIRQKGPVDLFSQMFMQACPPDSLPRENESSVRDLPLVKQN